MEKYIKKEQCIAALAANGISKDIANKLNNVSDDIADCIYKYAMTSAFFCCDGFISLSCDIALMHLNYSAKDVIYLVRSLAAAHIDADNAGQFLEKAFNECTEYGELRNAVYTHIREFSFSGSGGGCTSEEIEIIVNNAFSDLMKALSGIMEDIRKDMKIWKTKDEEYIMQLSELQNKLEESEARLYESERELRELREFKESEDKRKEAESESVSNDDFIALAKAIRKKRYHFTADIVKACRSKKISCNDVEFFLKIAANEEEFKNIIQMYLEN